MTQDSDLPMWAFTAERSDFIDAGRPVETLVHLTIVHVDVTVLSFPTVHTCASVRSLCIETGSSVQTQTSVQFTFVDVISAVGTCPTGGTSANS